MDYLLQIKNLSVRFDNEKKIIDNLNINLEKGKITCLVGESGSGKSITASSIIGMLPKNAEIEEGEIIFKGKDIAQWYSKAMNKIRGRSIYSIFQNAINAFNPSMTMENQIYNLVSSHHKIKKKEFYDKMIKTMEKLNFKNPEKVLKQYPFQLSGGMLQRMMIATAYFMRAELIIADEPTTALDVSVQKKILEEFNRMNKVYGHTILMITHDFGVVAEVADVVLVMKDGHIVEEGNVRDIFDNPTHEYTKALIRATFEKEKL